MRFFVAQNKWGELIVSRRPLVLDSEGFISFTSQPKGAFPDSIELSTKLASNEGAIIDVRKTPAEGYTRTTFDACPDGVVRTLGMTPNREPDQGPWIVYTKVLKRELAGRDISF